MTTPLRRQYLELKAAHPDAILFFRLGDFYETFDGDAEIVARELGVALTSRPMGGGERVPLAGVPAAAADEHVARLVGAGLRVAVCEQLEDPAASRGLVRRGVVRVVSPGAALDPALLDEARPNACAALFPMRAPAPGGGREWRIGAAAADVSTGEFRASELRPSPGDAASGSAGPGPPRALWERAAAELERLGAAELLLAAGAPAPPSDPPPPLPPARERPAAGFDPAAAARAIARAWPELGEAPAAALGLDERPAALAAAGAVLAYLGAALPAGPDGGGAGAGPGPLAHLSPPALDDPAGAMAWDAAALRALAVAEPGPGHAGGRAAPRTLLDAVDRCRTAAGRRRLRADLLAPLRDPERIDRRLDLVEALAEDPALRRRLGERLARLPDIERLLARAAAGLARPPELAALARGLLDAAAIAGLLAPERPTAAPGPAEPRRCAEPDPAAPARSAWADVFGPAGAEPAALPAVAEEPDPPGSGEAPAPALAAIAARLGPAPPAAAELERALEERPAADYGGGVVRAGADPEADAARARAADARARLERHESGLRAETGLAGLKLGRHRTFGWYLEAPSAELARRAGGDPPGWRRLQSLRAAQRFAEPRLLELGAEADADEAALAAAERSCVARLRAAAAGQAAAIRSVAAAAARLDAAWSLAATAAERGWTRPLVDRSGRLEIRGGRHPIVEAAAPTGAFTPNDLSLDAAAETAPQLLLVTGPNMAGKSTYLRQAALIAALAQAGSFVPADSARIGAIDRVFARVGAHDDLAAGRSTFMIEMIETARLLRGAGPRSLVLLDEIGRGTGTRDGLAIARAVAEALLGGAGGSDRGEREDGAEADPANGRKGAGSSSEEGDPANSGRGAGSGSEEADPANGRKGAGSGGEEGGLANGGGGLGSGSRADDRASAPDRPRALFATHFPELAELAEASPRAACAAVRAEEDGRGGMRFLHRVEPGAADRSYGVQVAAAAGLPAPVVARAAELLARIEAAAAPPPDAAPGCLPACAGPHPLVARLAAIDVDGVTPVEAINALYALRDQALRDLSSAPDPAP